MTKNARTRERSNAQARKRGNAGTRERAISRNRGSIQVNVELPAELHRTAKVRAAERNMTLRELVTAAVTEYLDHPGMVDIPALEAEMKAAHAAMLAGDDEAGERYAELRGQLAVAKARAGDWGPIGEDL